jgi:preprotein translocase subunit SecG
MYGFLLAVLVLDGIFLSVVILLQAGKGGGLAAVGGGGARWGLGVRGGRPPTTVLTRATWGAGAAFMVLALVLSIMSSRTAVPESVIQVNAPATQSAPAPVLPGLGEPAAAESEGNSGNEGN